MPPPCDKFYKVLNTPLLHRGLHCVRSGPSVDNQCNFGEVVLFPGPPLHNKRVQVERGYECRGQISLWIHTNNNPSEHNHLHGSWSDMSCIYFSHPIFYSPSFLQICSYLSAKFSFFVYVIYSSVLPFLFTDTVPPSSETIDF